MFLGNTIPNHFGLVIATFILFYLKCIKLKFTEQLKQYDNILQHGQTKNMTF